jgi:putative inorganic carbon (HCO3(-)) transporter
MRDYLIVALVLLSLPIGLLQPYYGALIYAWISYMYPHYFAWTFARTFPVAKVAAASVFGGVLFSRAWDLKPIRQREVLLMLALLAWFGVSSIFAIYPAEAWSKWQDMAKIILMAALTAMLLTDRSRIRGLFLVIAASIGFYGLKGGVFSIRTGGEYMVWGPGDSILGANNNFGLALNMALPFFWYLSKNCKSGMARWLLRATFFLSILAVMFTYSRASVLGLVFVLTAMVAKSKRILLLFGAILIAGMLVYPMLPDRWINRQETMASFEQDDSAMSRIDNWKFCWKLALDRPLIGGGFDYNSRETFAKYAPDFLTKYGGKVWDSHSIYFGILAAHGFPGLALFLGMILTSILSCRSVRRSASSIRHFEWAGDYCHMIELSFLALLVNGAFVNMEYFDLPYHLVGAVACLKVIVSKEVARVEAQLPSSTDLEAQVHLATA